MFTEHRQETPCIQIPTVAALLMVASLVGAAPALAQVVSWTNPDGGDWHEGANWSTGVPPGPDDIAAVTLHGTYTVTLSTADVTVFGLEVGDADVGNGIVTLRLIARTLTIEGAGTALVDGVLELNRGTIALDNAPFVNEGLLLAQGNSTINNDPGVFSNPAGGTIRVGVGSGTTLTVTNGFTNEGLIQLTNSDPSSDPSVAHPATLDVTNGTLVNLNTIDVLEGTHGGARDLGAELDNQGTINIGIATSINKNGGADHTNSGTINVTGGDLTLSLRLDTFTNTGTIDIADTRTLIVSGGSFNQDAGSIGGMGTLSLSFTTANFTTDFSNAQTELLTFSATFNGPGTLTNANSLTLNLSTINAPFANDGLLLVHSFSEIGSEPGVFSNPAGATIRVEGSDSNNAGLTVTYGFVNEGLIELTNSHSSSTRDARLRVTNGTLVNMNTIDVLEGTNGGARWLRAELDNQGTINIGIAAAITNSGGTHHTNSGTIDVTGGDLLLGDTFTNTGTIEIGDNRTLRVIGGILNQDDGSIGGMGTLSLGSATANFTTDFSNAQTELLMFSSTFNGPGTLTNANSLTLSRSTINAPFVNEGLLLVHGSNNTIGSGPHVNPAGGTIRIESGRPGRAVLVVTNGFVNEGLVELTNSHPLFGNDATLIVTDGALVNMNTIDVLEGTSGGPRGLSAELDNQGTINIGIATRISKPGNAHHTNSGTINVTAGDLTFLNPVTNTGAIDIADGRTLEMFVADTFRQDAGSTTLHNATLRSIFNPVDLQGGVLQGDGTVDADLINGGTVAPGMPGMPVGQLHVTGDYTQTEGGEFSVELAGMAPRSEFDVLSIDGEALLDGTLTINVLSGFAPPVGSMFDILTAATRNGVFVAVNASCLPGADRFLTTYDATTARLEVVNPLLGDMNCDCGFDAQDIEGFIVALFDPKGYPLRFPGCDINLADINGDGTVDALDIEPFIDLLFP